MARLNCAILLTRGVIQARLASESPWIICCPLPRPFLFFLSQLARAIAVAYVEREKRRRQRGKSMQVGVNFASSARSAAPFPWRFITNAQLLLHYESPGPAAAVVVQQDTLSCSLTHRGNLA